MDNLSEVFTELNKKEDEEGNRYALEIIDEDDVLDPWTNEGKLKEGLSAADWGKIVPCDIIYCEASVQDMGGVMKWRPILVVYKDGTEDSPDVWGLQITTTAPNKTKFRTQFRYRIQDWRKVGLRQPSFINYDHFVMNETEDIRRHVGFAITPRDAKGLLEAIKENYDYLIDLGYHHPEDKELLDDFIKYLESI